MSFPTLQEIQGQPIHLQQMIQETTIHDDGTFIELTKVGLDGSVLEEHMGRVVGYTVQMPSNWSLSFKLAKRRESYEYPFNLDCSYSVIKTSMGYMFISRNASPSHYINFYWVLKVKSKIRKVNK
ncbi:hypothetical protein COF68_05620 [Bacillus toyonensis]|uniref:hypothetical protein n=1 Tax=Bacillus toyonensis TaxID=155322 RepID=UPI000BFDB7E5|nr:hypothetical protein [Bacillus toyonensis]PHE64321.1 hypothetical protein COF68_05620 [Bacillus toyonensis]